MKKLFIFLFAVCSFFSSQPVNAEIAVPITEKLANGLEVLVLRDTRFNLVSTRLYVRTGSALERPEEAGISHLLEHMVFKGTEKRPKGAIAAEVEKAGGYLNASTSFSTTMYMNDLPAKEWQLGMDIVKDMAFFPALDPQELEAEKNVVLSELKMYEDDPNDSIFKNMQKTTLAGTPYAHPIIGYRETIKGITPEMIRNYIATHYQPQNMLLVVAGNVNTAEVLTAAKKLFGGLKNTQAISPEPFFDAEKLPSGASVSVQKGQWNTVYLGLSVPVAGATDARSIPADILAQLLGGDKNSLFYRTYKYEKQLVHDISVSNYSFNGVGLLYITAELDADKLETFGKSLLHDLATLKASQFTDNEIAAAKLNIEDQFYRVRETLSGLASHTGSFHLLFGAQGQQNYLHTLNQVDREALQKSIETWLKPEKLNMVVLAPEKAVLPDIDEIKKSWPVSTKQNATQNDIQVPPQQGEYERIVLDAKRTLILIPDKNLPYTVFDLRFQGGNALLKPAQQGLADLAANVLTAGTKHRNALEMERFLSEHAMNLSADTNQQSFTVQMRTPARFSRQATALLSEVLNHPALSADEVAREKSGQLADIRSTEDQPLGLMFRKLAPFLFPDSVYGYVPMGLPAQVQGFSTETVRAFWGKQVQQEWVLAIAGDFDREAMLAFARSLPQPTAQPFTLAPPAWGSKKTLNLTLSDREQAHLMLICETVPMNHPDSAGLRLLQTILNGQSGVLFADLRDKHALAYTVASFGRTMPQVGYMAFYIGTDPAKVGQAKQGFERIIQDIRTKPFSAVDIQRGKNKLLGDYESMRQSLDSRAGEAAHMDLLGLPLNYQRTEIEKAQKITAQELQKLAQKYLNLKQAYVVQLMP